MRGNKLFEQTPEVPAPTALVTKAAGLPDTASRRVDR